MSEPFYPERQLPEDPAPQTKDLSWYQLNIRYGNRPKGLGRATLAFISPVLICGAVVGVAEIIGNGSNHENAVTDNVYTDVPPNTFGKMAVDVTMFEGSKPQIEWSRLP